MKKIFVYMGTRRGEKSHSRRVIELLREQLERFKEEDIIYSIHTPDTININSCTGCCTCFGKGVCVMDGRDNFDRVKEDILESDFIILVSPVYAHSVTADMKLFIDRISYWLHLFRLAGKKSMAISVSSTNGNDYVNAYLKKILELAGTQVIGTLGVTVDGPRMLEEKEFLEETLPFMAKRIVREMKSRDFNTSREQEKFFLSMQMIYENTDEESRGESYEYNYWKDNGMLAANSLKAHGLLVNA